MTERVRNIWKGIGISVVAAIVVAALIWGVRETPNTVKCESIRYTIEDLDERQYVTERELNGLLEKEGQYPVGKALRNISLQGIERTIRAHDLVRTTECYLTPRKEVRVRLTQRVPLLRVMTASDTYLIDEDSDAVRLRDSRGELSHCLRHKSRELTHVQVAHIAVYFSAGSHSRDGVEHDDKLRMFLDEGTEAMAGKKYTELDVRFRGQVVGR